MAREVKVKIVINGKDDSGPAFASLGGSLQRVGEIAGGILTAQVFSRIADGITSLGFAAIDTTKQLEQNRIGLKGILGSLEAADTTIARVKEEAKKTPFELPGLLEMTQLLATATKDGDRSVNLILSLGDALSFVGKGEPELKRIVANMQQIQAVGRASLLDVRQFGNAGIPVFELLADKTGLAGEALADFISDGGVTFELLEELFNNASEAGGRFFNAMEAQSGTLTGIQSNISDTVGIIGTEVVQQSGLFDILKDSAQGFLGFLDQHKDDIISFFKNAVESIIDLRDTVMPIFNTISEFIGGILAKALEKGKQLLTDLEPAFDSLKETFDTARPFLEKVFEVVKIFVEQGLTALWDAIQNYVVPAIDILAEIVERVTGLIVALLTPLFDWLSKNPELAKTISDVALAIGGLLIVKSVATHIWNAVAASIEWAASLLSKVVPAIGSTIGSVGTLSSNLVAMAGTAGPFVAIGAAAAAAMAIVGKLIDDSISAYEQMVQAQVAAGEVHHNANQRVIDFLQANPQYQGKGITSIQALSNLIKSNPGDINPFAMGGSFVTNGPMHMLVGDNPGSREKVTVTPIQGNNTVSPGEPGGSSIIINVEGSIIKESDLADTVIKAIRSLAAMEAKNPSDYLNLSGR
jgi:tape measure domain-containing protein